MDEKRGVISMFERIVGAIFVWNMVNTHDYDEDAEKDKKRKMEQLIKQQREEEAYAEKFHAYIQSIQLDPIT